LRIGYFFNDWLHVANENVDRELLKMEDTFVCTGAMLSHDKRYSIWGCECCGNKQGFHGSGIAYW